MASINIANITKETKAVINIEQESNLRRLMQVLHNLDYRWGSGDKAMDFVPFSTFRPLTIWLQNGVIYYDSGLNSDGLDLQAFNPRGRKKKYPRVPVPDNQAAAYTFPIMHKLAINEDAPVLSIAHIRNRSYTNHVRVKLLPFKPGRPVYVGASMRMLSFIGKHDDYYLYEGHSGNATINEQGKVLATNVTDWLNSTVYCAPKIAAVYAARRAKYSRATSFIPTEFDDYFKQQELMRIGDQICTLEHGVIIRTENRIDAGIYFKLPDSFPQRPETGVHLSTLDDKLLAYYPSNRHILDDIPQRIKPGRYLKKYFPDMSDDDIRTHSAKIIAGSGLKFFSSSEDMFRIYRELLNNGVVESCMSKDRWDRHPLDAYHESDVELAVMYEFGEPKARALYNKQNKHFPMIYGHWEKMKILLEQAGFKHATMCGAKINKIVIGHNRILMPYIDSKRPLNRSENKSTYVDVFDDYCIISDDGAYNANQYDNGYIHVDGVGDREDMRECDHCGDDYPDGDGFYVDFDNITICEHCWDNETVELYVHGSTRSIRAIHSEDFILINGEYYEDESAAEYHDYRLVDDEWRHIEDLVFVEDLGEYVLNSEMGKTVFYVEEGCYSIDWILSNTYIEEDGSDITTTETIYPIGSAKSHFAERPRCISGTLWDTLPEPTVTTEHLTEAA
jgi:hypothetical protein